MADPGVMELAGARPTKELKKTSIQTVKWIGGLQTQRSPFMSIDTRYNSRFLGGKPDSLLNGLNCEVSNKLTLQRRPGLLPYGTESIPAPLAFYSWQQTSPPNITVMADTASAVYTYSPTTASSIFSKAAGAGQTNFYGIVDTLYMGDGIDLYKWSGPAIANPTVAPTLSSVVGGTYSTRTYRAAYTYVTLNGETESSPISTLVVSGGNLLVVDSPAAVAGAVGWNVYLFPAATGSLTKHNLGVIPFGTNFTEPIANAGSTILVPSSNTTGNVVNWGIVGPTNAPTLTNTPLPPTYSSWGASTWYSPSLTILDTNSNIQLLTTGGVTGSTQPTWNVTVGGTTLESVHGGTAVWTNKGSGTWAATTVYAVGAFIYVTFSTTVVVGGPPPNPNPRIHYPPPTTITTTYHQVFQCTTAGTSGTAAPTWVPGTGTTVTDNTVVWTNIGNQQTWLTNIGASTNVSLNTSITDSNGNTENIITPGKSGTMAPTWATAMGATTVDNAATWLNAGPAASGTGGEVWNYVYAYYNSATGQFSDASPVGGPITLAPESYITVQGVGSTDPQVDLVAIFRTLAAGAFYYFDGYVLNTPNWTFADTTPDANLDTDIYAPLALINAPPPAGLVDFEFFAGRLWGSVGAFLYYSSSDDNAEILNFTFNGVSAESWDPENVIPFNAAITRIMAISGGLLVFTTEDLWIVTGTDLTNFQPFKILAGHGLSSYNAVDIDGGTIYVYTSDGEFLSVTPNAGSLEIGFPIGDTLDQTFLPSSVYVARHVSGSEDNAVYLANGSTGWFRLNPNQVGASASGEQAPVWSPFAAITNGCMAVQSIEVAFGVHKLLVGQAEGSGPILMRDLDTFSDNGTPYVWNAVMGSIVLAPPGMTSDTESITTESVAVGTTPGVAVLCDEISGTFETLPIKANDPPGQPVSSSIYSYRYYLSQGTISPAIRNILIQISGVAAATKDELLTLTIRAGLEPEQS